MYTTRDFSIKGLSQRYKNIYATLFILKNYKLNNIILEYLLWYPIEYKNKRIQGFIRTSQCIEENYKNGKLHGVYKEYKNGKLIKECNYKNGLLDGEYSFYTDSGSCIEGNYSSGKLSGRYVVIKTDRSS